MGSNCFWDSEEQKHDGMVLDDFLAGEETESSEELSEEGGQAGLTPPEEGGVQISLRNSAEAEIYTGFIAEVVEKEIQETASNALLVDLTGNEDVTAAVFDMNQVVAMDYPRTEEQGNML